MSKKIIVAVTCVLVMALVFASGFLVAQITGDTVIRSGENVIISVDQYNVLTQYMRLSEIRQLVEQYYYADYDQQALYDGSAKGMVYSLGDIYADYFTPAEFAKLMQDQEGNYSGIGIKIVENEEGMCTVVTVFKDSPALAAGIVPGDLVITVDGVDVRQQSTAEIAALVRGETGTNVSVMVLRGEEYLTFDIQRAAITANRIEYRMIGDIGYISIDEFTGDDVEGFKEGVSYIEGNNASGLIVDLRYNGGGLVDDAVGIADILLPEGIVVYTQDKNGEKVEEKSDMRYLGLPLVVLVNEYTASASEILAGAIQDYGAGKLVGQQTFGKGIVQSYIPFKDGAALKITTAYYFTPNGRSIHGEGLTPDYVVENSEEALNNPYLVSDDKDNQLQKALEVLREQIGN